MKQEHINHLKKLYFIHGFNKTISPQEMYCYEEFTNKSYLYFTQYYYIEVSSNMFYILPKFLELIDDIKE